MIPIVPRGMRILPTINSFGRFHILVNFANRIWKGGNLTACVAQIAHIRPSFKH